ncbi:MAG: hypothetical protein PVH63_03315 [Balneolaceae bacterium]|jgi:trehalose/maltose hydrolase-like predicted phosphorylase
MKRFPIFISLFFLLMSVAQAQETESTWIVQADSINPANYYGVAVANGMIGLVSSAKPLQMDDIVLNGVYDYYGRGRVSNILKGFNFANVQLDIDGERVGQNNVSGMRQELNMKEASVTTSFRFGTKAEISYTVRALRQLPYTSLIDVTVTPQEDIDLVASSVIEAPDILRGVHNYYSEIDRPHVIIPLMTSEAKSPTGKHTVAASNSFIFSEKHGNEPEIIHEDWAHNMHLAKFKKRLKKNEPYRFSIVASETSTEHFDDPLNEAERLTIYAKLQGRDRLLEGHRKAWSELWQSDIIVEGSPEDQRDIRFALYHLYSFARKGTAYSLSPMGLSGLGYNGHVFWDTELWMLPPLLVLHPDIAKSLLEYRYERLEAARQKAFAHGYKGAMFPWESDDTGQEATPVWALTGPYEQHISATIGVAFWNYFRVTHDRVWLREKGFPVLKEIADFWISRVEKDSEGHYNINNVVGADEWAENIDNDAYTNGAAINALKAAVKAAGILGIQPDPQWSEVAEHIPILEFENGVTREHASYEGEQIKQADVNLLSYPLGIVTSRDQILKNLTYYEPRIGAGPAMSHSVLSVLYSRLGKAEKAYELFKRGYKPNEVPPFGVLAEAAGGTNPYFATGAGGMLQAVINGFGGIEITDQGIKQLETHLPQDWKSLKVTGVGTDDKTFETN